MEIKQAFAELGLTAQANLAEAKAAYRTLAMRWHPDVNVGTETDTRMKIINVAYALVCQHLDVQLRNAKPAAPTKQNDDLKPSLRTARQANGFTEFDWKTGFKTRHGKEKTPEEHLHRTIRVSLYEAAFGCVKRVNGMEADTCARCAGSGEFAVSWTVGSKCMKCFGAGLLDKRDGCGTLAYTGCDACKGSGIFRPQPPECQACKGTGKTERRAWLVDVPIFAGTQNGAVIDTRDIRVRAGLQSLPSNLKLTVEIEKHPLFSLSQDRLSVTVPVSVWRWTLGGHITVPTLDGSARVELPSRPSPLLIKNQGWPEFKAAKRRKPLFVLPKIIYPDHVRAEERGMLQLLDMRSHMPEVQGWDRNVQAWVESSAQEQG